MTEPEERQRVERVTGRRARLTQVPGTIPDADALDRPDADGTVATGGERGPNDDRLRREKPPHW